MNNEATFKGPTVPVLKFNILIYDEPYSAVAHLKSLENYLKIITVFRMVHWPKDFSRKYPDFNLAASHNPEEIIHISKAEFLVEKVGLTYNSPMEPDMQPIFKVPTIFDPTRASYTSLQAYVKNMDVRNIVCDILKGMLQKWFNGRGFWRIVESELAMPCDFPEKSETYQTILDCSLCVDTAFM